MVLSNFFFSDSIMYPLVMGLLHSLWQGAVIFFSVYILSIIVKSSDLRYRLASGGLVLLFVLFVMTFLHYTNTTTSYNTGLIDLKDSILSFDIGSDSNRSERVSLYVEYSGILNSKIDKVCILWFCGVVVMFLRVLWGLLFVRKLKSSVIASGSPTLDKFTNDLQSRLEIGRNVVLGLSELVSGPLTVGWLKPVILLPIATVNRLSVVQLEFIIAHELAHIKRNDYLVNILQNLVEVMLFFNPFVWLISSRIRIEREHCCDDIALELCGGDRVELVKTLIAVADISNMPRLGMAMAKKDSLFILRIKRIMNMETQQTFKLGQLIALIGILFISAGGFLYANGSLVSELQSGLYSQKDTSSVLEEERERLIMEVRALRQEAESNSIELPGIVIRGDKSNQNVLSDLEGQLTAHSPKFKSEEEMNAVSKKSVTNDDLWKQIEKREERLQEIETIRKASFESNFKGFWIDISKFVSLEDVREIKLKEGVLYLDNLAQSNEKYREVLTVFERHFLKETYLDLNTYVKNKEVGLSKYRDKWSLALPHTSEDGNTGPSYWTLKEIQR